MSQVIFRTTRRATSIAKKAKKAFKLDTLSDAKELVASLSGYSDWTHLKRETEAKVKSPTGDPEISTKTAKQIAFKLAARTGLSDRDAMFFVVTEFPYSIKAGGDLEHFLTDFDIKLLSKVLASEFTSDLPYKEKQSSLDIMMEATQQHWSHRATYEHAALYWYLSSRYDCARSHVHLGNMLIKGCLGVQDFKTGTDLLLNGLPYRSKLFFEGSITAPLGDELHEMQKHIPDTWLNCSKALRELNIHTEEHYIKSLECIENGIKYCELVDERVGYKDTLANLYLGKAYLLCDSLTQGIVLEAHSKEHFLDVLHHASELGNGYAQNEFNRYAQMYLSSTVDGGRDCPSVNPENVMQYIAGEFVGSHIPVARHIVLDNLYKHAISNSEFYQSYPHIKVNMFKLLERTVEDSKKWPHLRLEFLKMTASFYGKMHSDRVFNDEAIELYEKTLYLHGSPDLLYLVGMLIKDSPRKKELKGLYEKTLPHLNNELCGNNNPIFKVKEFILIIDILELSNSSEPDKPRFSELRGAATELLNDGFLGATLMTMANRESLIANGSLSLAQLLDWAIEIEAIIDDGSFAISAYTGPAEMRYLREYIQIAKLQVL
ncbi:TPA: hypothetical protein I7730_15725 [Vibrio vulnificus]|uniref:Uncharacterized protein n=1 Tax=Vibrio vulnificus TaxID=672 RepID=A0A8H9N1S4_VIBVL|nr:hypothetical protein [Vibrio vulnificus]HAS8541231.1 hypothetical protein [Vibrio vulnificus]